MTRAEHAQFCVLCSAVNVHACSPMVSLEINYMLLNLDVDGYKQKTCPSRRDSVLLNRLRIGHTRLTHSYLLSGDDILECGTCQCPLTVKYILTECVDFNDVRNKHFVASSIKDVFDNVEAQEIIDFIKETHFYKQL